jgi:hypothetical protein
VCRWIYSSICVAYLVYFCSYGAMVLVPVLLLSIRFYWALGVIMVYRTFSGMQANGVHVSGWYDIFVIYC